MKKNDVVHGHVHNVDQLFDQVFMGRFLILFLTSMKFKHNIKDVMTKMFYLKTNAINLNKLCNMFMKCSIFLTSNIFNDIYK